MRLPILVYHNVGHPVVGAWPSLTVLPEQFERQMTWLADHGYVGIRPSDWLAWRREGKFRLRRPVMITFDDAYANVAEHALPVLRRLGLTATVYVVTARIGASSAWDVAKGLTTLRLMDPEQIQHWAGEGIEFGAHGRTHVNLTTLNGSQLAEEVEGSADDLADLLGVRTISFAYPYGSHDLGVRQCVQRVVDMALSSESGLNGLRTDPFMLHRAAIQPTDDMSAFAWRIRLGKLPSEWLHDRMRALIKRRHVAAATVRQFTRPRELIHASLIGPKDRGGR
jgi:peptidoglycan/xylan/chitin deacetylase (PgdA/CDA1 family)